MSSSWDFLIEQDRANKHLAREKPKELTMLRKMVFILRLILGLNRL
jgi:hypothetical protein